MSTIRQIREITGTILLVLNTAGALVFLLLGEETFSLLLLTAALAVFLLRLRNGKTDSFGNRQTDRDTSYIRYCPYCGYIGSQLPGESVPPCPACGRLLIATDTTLEEYTGLSVHRRSVLKKRWSSFVKDR